MTPFLKTSLKAVVLGFALVLPGVSAGTLAFVMGIYEKLIHELSLFKRSHVRDFIFLFSFQKRKKKKSLSKSEKNLGLVFCFINQFRSECFHCGVCYFFHRSFKSLLSYVLLLCDRHGFSQCF